MHSFLDESRRGNRYFVTAVIIAPASLHEVTKSVRSTVRPGQRRTHFSDERPSERRRLLDGYCRLAVRAQVAVAEYRGGDDQLARERCLRGLAIAATSRGVARMILDSRGLDRDKLDRRLFARLQREGTLGAALSYEHLASWDELLLCLPDAIGWAYGMGGLWREQVAPLVELVATPES
jgi:hypothetical protein